ncbi:MULTISPECIES: hypothetical protein [Citrifermentans]|uniref:Uncharacterized protein n=1 Tax=Citrifermentans bemidjiense (strain ATCC BAA-1014 / DSM 16622 / JCM 12645 / Bem) TaxID=404380 RepID=B5EJ09_CITBB|nr:MULTISPECIES: hypothetical protein [Citrifermentans]ACH39964.1 hypothetical protein Gbem_2961 [Citrifermentans bemidjiense Bem]
MTQCPECEGKKVVACAKCDGKGNKYFVPVLDIWEYDCDCYGSGVVTCSMCNGLGYVTHTEMVVPSSPRVDLRYFSH